MDMKKLKGIVFNGIVTENPTFRLVLGMCPTLAITTTVSNGLGMGLGFTLAITLLSAIRELLGSGTLLGIQVMPDGYQPMAIITQAPGGFIMLGLLMVVMNSLFKAYDRRRASKEG